MANPAYVIPSDTRAAGQTGHVADHNELADDFAYIVGGAPGDLLRQPSGCVAATMPRHYATAACSALTSGTLYVMALPLAAGMVVTNITFAANTTAESGGTHAWYVLLDSSRVVKAVTADQTGAAFFAASATATVAVTSPYTAAATGIYYVGVCVVATGMPTFSGGPAVAHGLVGKSPALCGSSSTAQTTPPTVGTTMAAITAADGYAFYAYVT